MNADKQKTLLVIGALLVLGLGALFFLLEEVEETVEHPGSVEARRNPFLAVQRGLEARGHVVEHAPALTTELLAAHEGVIWLAEDRIALVQRNQAVVDWLVGGGRLLLGTAGGVEAEHEDDPVVLQLRTLEEETVAGAGDGHGRWVGPYAHEDDSTSLPDNEVPDVDSALRFACSEGDVLAKVGPFGAGRLAVVPHVDRYRSRFLDDSAGAALFGDVTRALDLPKRILLVSGEQPPRLSELLWTHGRPVVVSSAALLLAWLLFASTRLGPLLPPRARDNRSLMEHVAATGSLLWRQGARDVLLDSVRGALKHRLAIVRADKVALPDDELARALAAESGLTFEDVRFALFAGAHPSPAAFARQIAHLQRLRAALSR